MAKASVNLFKSKTLEGVACGTSILHLLVSGVLCVFCGLFLLARVNIPYCSNFESQINFELKCFRYYYYFMFKNYNQNYKHIQSLFFQDLQDEIEKHREMYLSLNSTGKKLMSGLDSQEDATLLHRRLEEMNQRWNYLKAKSIAIRL